MRYKERFFEKFANADALVNFYLENRDVDYDELSICLVSAFLIIARDTDLYSEFYINKALDAIMADSQVINGIEHNVACNYGRYALDDFGFIYDENTYEECLESIKKRVRALFLREMKFEKVANNLFGDIEYSQNMFVRSFLSLRIKGEFQNWALEQIQKHYPEMTINRLSTYIKFRKAVSYNMTLRNNTNKEIIDKCADNGFKITWARLNSLRTVLGYPEEVQDYSDVPLRENPVWKKTHRNELEFFKHTDSDKITDIEAKKALTKIQDTLNYSDEEMSILINWLNKARYEGVYVTKIDWVPESLSERYFKEVSPKQQTEANTPDKILFRMRKDIGQTLGENTRCLKLIAWRTHTGPIAGVSKRRTKAEIAALNNRYSRAA